MCASPTGSLRSFTPGCNMHHLVAQRRDIVHVQHHIPSFSRAALHMDCDIAGASPGQRVVHQHWNTRSLGVHALIDLSSAPAEISFVDQRTTS